MHAHVAVPRAAEFVKPHLDLSTIPLAISPTPRPRRSTPSRRPTSATRIAGNDQRLADLDAMGIDMQLVCPPPPQCYYTVPLDIAVQATRMVNDGLAEYVAKKPDRFVALGGVPLSDGNEAAKELERCMKHAQVQGRRNPHQRRRQGTVRSGLRAVLEEGRGARRAGAASIPTASPQAERLTRFYFNNVIGNPLETTIALHYLIFDGVLERHPNLKILAVHGGGYLGGYSGRIDHAWGARSDSHGDLPKPPTQYLKKIYFDTVVFTPDQLEALVKTFGVDHVVMGTDYPFDMADFDPIEHVVSTRLRCGDDGGDRRRQREEAAGAVSDSKFYAVRCNAAL